jgi:hypothetical protein
MPRKKRQRRQARSGTPAPPTRVERPRWPWLRSLVVWTLSIMGAVSALYAFVPRVSFSVGNSVDAYQALTDSGFSVANNGNLATTDVEIYCDIANAETETRIRFKKGNLPEYAHSPTTRARARYVRRV